MRVRPGARLRVGPGSRLTARLKARLMVTSGEAEGEASGEAEGEVRARRLMVRPGLGRGRDQGRG